MVFQKQESPEAISTKLDRACVSLRSWQQIKSRNQPSAKKIKLARDSVAQKAQDGVQLVKFLTDGVTDPKIKVNCLLVSI